MAGTDLAKVRCAVFDTGGVVTGTRLPYRCGGGRQALPRGRHLGGQVPPELAVTGRVLTSRS
ncbi:hypothetical protein [Nonomuraea sp. NPDC049141]|uniref:hypothetical protein n=1 Tax=Nonomuraea sp. NPDC049141 TaxID=3155500 RepID=UPI0034019C1B